MKTPSSPSLPAIHAIPAAAPALPDAAGPHPPRSSEVEPELQIFNHRGCLTPEVMCFIEHLGTDQRAAVERHVKSCVICAQEQAAMSLAAERLTRARPRITIPAEVSVLAWQAAMPALSAQKRLAGRKLRLSLKSPSPPPPALPWYQSSTFWMVSIAGLAIALAVALLAALILSGCACEETKAPPAPTVKLGPPTRAAVFSGELTAVAAAQGGWLAAGSPKGEVWLRTPAAAKAPSSQPAHGHPPALRALDSVALHQGPITALAFDQSGAHLLTGGGKTVALWSTADGALIRRLTGPQGISAVALSADGKTAFFGTSEGHVLEWSTDTTSAKAVAGFACAGSAVSPSRLVLPEDKRCPYGTFVQPDEGQPSCAYPVTALRLEDQRLLRACRQGVLSVMDRKSGRRSYTTAGYLRALASLPEDKLFLGRDDGELRVYDPATKEVVHTLEPAGAPSAAASDGPLLAVAQRTTIRLYGAQQRRPSASASAPGEVIWLALDLSAGTLRAMTVDGTLVTFPVTLDR